MKPNQDVELCAAVIYADLAACAGSRNFHDLCTLSERLGKLPLFSSAITAKQGGFSHDNEIILSAHCTLPAYQEIIPHELVHALALTPRWAFLNYHIRGYYDRTDFLEAVATRVGRMFLKQLPPCTFLW